MRHFLQHTTTMQKNWKSWASWLLVTLTFLVTPATAIAATTTASPAASLAASPADTEVFGPSSYLPFLRNRYCSGTRAIANPVGAQIYGPTGYAQSDFNLLQEAKPVWLRNSIEWSAVEPTNRAPSQYVWRQADRVVQAAFANCANMIITIDSTPDWATISSSRSPIKVENLKDFKEFVTTLVERYDGDGINDAPNGAIVNYWEFYNEPDFGSEHPGEEGWGEYGTRYADMLKTVYDAVHTANPNAKVVFGGIAYNLFANEGNGGLFVRNFFQNVLDAGGGEYFDIMNFHYYPFEHNRTVWTETNSSGLIEKHADIKAKMTKAGIGDKPIMLTEIGWHSATTNAEYPSNEIYQARRVLELLTQAAALGSMSIIWWVFDDQGPEFPYSTGLITANAPPSKKLGYSVYQVAAQRIGNARFDAAVIQPTVTNDLEAYRFIDNSTNKPFYVAWLNPVALLNSSAAATFDENATQNLSVDGSSATILNRDGSVKQTINDGDDGQNDGKLNVSVGRSPIYIIIK